MNFDIVSYFDIRISKLSLKGGEYDIMKKGFTLIELLIVIAIIAILAAILFVSIGTQPLLRSRDAKRVSDLQNLRTALALYYTDQNRYPSATEFTTSGAVPNFTPTYSPALPADPNDNDPSNGQCTGYTPTFPGTMYAADDFGYRYARGTTDQTYVLQACLEDPNNAALGSDCDNTGADPACVADTATSKIFDIHS